TLLGGAAALWPLAARAQQAAMPVVGFLGGATLSAWVHWTAAFVRRLRELGWIEGRSIAIEYRWAEGRSERYTEIAAEFVRLKVNVIVTAGASVVAAKQATSVIPIVFAVAADPLGTGHRKLRRIAEKLAECAPNGEPWAICQVADRIDGKATAEIKTEQTQRYVVEVPPQLSEEEWVKKYSPPKLPET